MDKRVEFHCHTCMSKMDGVSTPEEVIEYAYELGLGGIAITDHASIQALPKVEKLAGKYEGKDFRIIYGMEAYIVDDEKTIVYNDRGQSLNDECVIVDFETTGFSAVNDEIIEIALIKIKGDEFVDAYHSLVKPKTGIPKDITKLTGITNKDVEEAREIGEVITNVKEFIGDAFIVAYNAPFDIKFLGNAYESAGFSLDNTIIDIREVAKLMLSECDSWRYRNVAKALDIDFELPSCLKNDTLLVEKIFEVLRERLIKQGRCCLSDIKNMGVGRIEYIKKQPTYHANLIVKNQEGMKNLLNMVTASNLKYYDNIAVVPKSVLRKMKSGLLIGSACEEGELFRAIIDEEGEREIERIQELYNFFEIQPTGNKVFLYEEEYYPDIKTEEDLRELNRKILELGRKYNKPVIATCDVHFARLEDSVRRADIKNSMGYENACKQAPLYLRSTEEMLKEFEYLGEEARRVVVDNTRLLAEGIESVQVIGKKKHHVRIPGAFERVEEWAYGRLFEMYGKPLPDMVSARVEQELNWIKEHGTEQFFCMAKILTDDIRHIGYESSTRGSIGSSLVAYALGITTSNPLPAHYYCTVCHKVEFMTGFQTVCLELEDKKCPVCGSDMKKDGFNIPVESCFGYHGEKEPDICLNVPMNWKAYAKELLLRIDGVGDVVSPGCLRRAKDSEVKSGTGIYNFRYLLIPKGIEASDLLPLQISDYDNDECITHFDYFDICDVFDKIALIESADCHLLGKLAIKTGVKLSDIDICDKKLHDFSKLVSEKMSDVKGLIPHGDNIMFYLVDKGVKRELAYEIMEKVRRGRGLSGEQVIELLRAGVPEGYIESYKNTKYLKYKSYIVEDLIRDLKLEYFKLYYPQEFLDTYFELFASEETEEVKRGGKEYVERRIRGLTNSKDNDKYTYQAFILALEMYQRGIELKKC